MHIGWGSKSGGVNGGIAGGAPTVDTADADAAGATEAEACACATCDALASSSTVAIPLRIFSLWIENSRLLLRRFGRARVTRHVTAADAIHVRIF